MPISEREIEFATTWDELLTALYPGGSSRIVEADVPSALWSVLRDSKGFAAEIAALKEEKGPNFNIDRGVSIAYTFEMVKADVHRQFSGLGYIEEVTESGSTSDFREVRPFFRTVWRLTREGQQYLALLRGFRRESEE